MSSRAVVLKALAVAVTVQVLLLVSTAAFAAPLLPTQAQPALRAGALKAAPNALACGACCSAALAVLAVAGARRAVQRRALSVGTPVTWNGKAGTVKYVGPAKFASGEWVGVELSGGGGMHDGTVLGSTYFECPAGCGVFTQEAQLTAAGAAPAVPPAPARATPSLQPSEDCAVKVQVCVGYKVSFNGKEGTVKYVGPTKFAAGEWVGIELAGGGGMHNGTVLGTAYFECPPHTGVFAAASQLTILATA